MTILGQVAVLRALQDAGKLDLPEARLRISESRAMRPSTIFSLQVNVLMK
jgi:hypothetical protein